MADIEAEPLVDSERKDGWHKFIFFLVTESLLYGALLYSLSDSAYSVVHTLYLLQVVFTYLTAATITFTPPQCIVREIVIIRVVGKITAVVFMLVCQLLLFMLLDLAIWGSCNLNSPIANVLRTFFKARLFDAPDWVIRLLTVGFAGFFAVNSLLNAWRVICLFMEFKRSLVVYRTM
ncbi:hypothetical protein PMAYCL1PPCAC_04754 [Pristionchus mayeri]|uniref:Uncharacterized protein n=1 Tax=Pristionchus mayeri TaxID=1317129 RepID=A0AAN4Z7J4_9BILA|nr:hypothetical protein PMAYCL1PPCAC_04754 [Pristionchus mayeri]